VAGNAFVLAEAKSLKEFAKGLGAVASWLHELDSDKLQSFLLQMGIYDIRFSSKPDCCAIQGWGYEASIGNKTKRHCHKIPFLPPHLYSSILVDVVKELERNTSQILAQVVPFETVPNASDENPTSGSEVSWCILDRSWAGQ